MFHSVSIDKRNQDLGREVNVSKETFPTREAAIEWANNFFTVELVINKGLTKAEL